MTTRPHTWAGLGGSSLGGAPLGGGEYTPTDLFSVVNEEMPSDADYIQSVVNPTHAPFELKLGNMVDPGIHTNHKLTIRLRKSLASGNHSAKIQLFDGSTLITEFIELNLTEHFTNKEFSLSEVEASNITNYNNLRVRIIANPV